MKKIALGLLVGLSLVGCAGTNHGTSLNVIETRQYLHDERKLALSFVQAQKAVFMQQARCDSSLRFQVDQTQPSYARVIQPLIEGAQPDEWEKMMILGITLQTTTQAKVLGLTLREGGQAEVKAQLYSYYTPSKRQIKALYAALQHPELCPGETPPEIPKKQP